jgi:DNA polymerase III delta subunit
MIYLFAGEDQYESYGRALLTAQNLASKSDSSINVVNADEISDINYILQLLEGVDMFSSTGVLVLKRFLNNKKFVEYFFENFNKLNEFEIVIWQDSKADTRLKFVKAVQTKKLLFNYDLPKDGEMKNWISLKTKELSIPLTPAQITFLFERIQFNKFAVINELQKLSTYIKAKSLKRIEDSVLEDILGLSVKGDMWRFLDYIGAKNNNKAIIEFSKLTKYEENTQLLISMIDREIRLMLQYKYAKANGHDTSELKLAPFILKKVADKARNFSDNELKELLKKLFITDLKIKSGLVDEKTAMLVYLAEL